MPLRSLPRGSIALRNAHTNVIWRQCGVSARVGATAQRRWASDNKKLGKDEERPFYLQLNESIYERVQKEKAEQIRIQSLQQRTARGQFFATVFACLLTASIGYYYGQLIPPPKPDTSSTAPLETFQNISEANMEAAWTDFRDIVGRENITLDRHDLESHSGSSWSSHPSSPGDVPFCVEVSAIMKRRGETSLEGHFAATRGGVCIDFSRMDKIINLHKEDSGCGCSARCRVGIPQRGARKGWLVLSSRSRSSAMIGGMVGTGTMKDWVVSLTVVLADGTIIRPGNGPRKSSAGYDLTRMFVGSEGTLGLVTEATLKIIPRPQHTSVAVWCLPSIRAAAECVFKVVGASVPIAAIEILDEVQMQCINDAGQPQNMEKNAPTLFFKFAGHPKRRQRTNRSSSRPWPRNPAPSASSLQDQNRKREDLWQARKEALWSVMAKGKGDPNIGVWTTDVASRKQKIAQSGLLASIVGHVGDGNFHSIILYDRNRDFDKASHLVHEMVKRAIELEGTATGEHGVGIVKRDYLPHELGNETVDAMRQLKKAVDPLCLLNCDKVVRAAKPGVGEVAEW
ncbi:D-lactate dehydrogenase mitochondrial precursor [Bipolaris maydis]|nr:D-lactate dehydrogenase mitochondrial precursor [Bipolaris maydis]